MICNCHGTGRTHEWWWCFVVKSRWFTYNWSLWLYQPSHKYLACQHKKRMQALPEPQVSLASLPSSCPNSVIHPVLWQAPSDNQWKITNDNLWPVNILKGTDKLCFPANPAKHFCLVGELFGFKKLVCCLCFGLWKKYINSSTVLKYNFEVIPLSATLYFYPTTFIWNKYYTYKHMIILKHKTLLYLTITAKQLH